MKNTSVRSLQIAAFVLLTPLMSFAHPDGHGNDATVPPASAGKTPAEKLPATMQDTLTAIQNQSTSIRSALKDGKLADVAANALTLNQLVQHIVGQLPADHRSAAKEIAGKQAKFTAELVRAANAGASKPAADIFTKITGNIRALELFAH